MIMVYCVKGCLKIKQYQYDSLFYQIDGGCHFAL